MICPNCHNDQTVTESNYGALFTCKSCQAVYFIGFDGNPEFGEVQPYEEPQSTNSQGRAQSTSSPFELPQASFQSQEPSEPISDFANLPPTNLPDVVSAVMDELPQTNELAAAINPMQPLVDFNQNEFAVNPEPFELTQSANAQFADVAKEISDYGNSETQIAHLNYDLRVSGLDTVEIINGFKEAIDDSRFGWDVGEVMKTMRAGEIRFEKLNPVKAYILAKRLQFLNVEKTWKQHAVG